MLVGRESELRELLAATATALSAGRGWTALIGGDAGIGKTRLVAEFADRLRVDGIAVAWAACTPDGGAPPYWPWSRLLARLGRPELVGPTPGGAEADPELARFLLFDAVANALQAVAPVLLVLDDVQWADAPSLCLLDGLGPQLGTAPVIVVGTYRDTDPAADRVAAIRAERRLILGGLAADELAAAVADVTGELIEPSLAAALHRRTGGNPFFAAEVVRLLRAEGTVAGPTAAGAVPHSVRAVLERRLDRLAVPTTTALRAAAALGAEIDVALLAEVVREPQPRLVEHLQPALAAGLLATTAEGGGYRFPHELVAETLAAHTPSADQLALHRQAGAALRRRAGGTGDPAAVARHLLAAARLSGDAAEAVDAARVAADAAAHAMRHTGYEDAVRWLEAGLAVLATTSADTAADRGALLCALGEAALAAGDPRRSRRAYLDAIEHARAGSRAELLATAALGITGGAAGFEMDLLDPERTALLAEALDALPRTDSTLRCAVTARLSLALAFTSGEPRRAGLAADAVAMARRIDDPRALAAALAAQCDALAGPEHVTRRRNAAAEIIALAAAGGDRTVELLGRRLRLVARAEAGDWAGVDAEIGAYERVAGPLRQARFTWYVPLWRGMRAQMRGERDRAAEHTAELERLVTIAASPNAEVLALTQRFVAMAADGRAAELTRSFESFLRLTPEQPAVALCTLVLLRAVEGRRTEASRLLDQVLMVHHTIPRDSEWLPAMAQLAVGAALTGHRVAARRQYDELAPFAGLFVVEGIGAGTWGSVDAHLGLLADALGDAAAARRHFAVALDVDNAAGAALGERTRRWAGSPFPAPVGTRIDGRFLLDGEVWTLEFAGRRVQVRDAKGLRDIAALLARAGREVAVHELAGGAIDRDGAGELADRRSIGAYRRRLAELEEQLADAQNRHDPGWAGRAAAERDALIEELVAVTGLGGRPRAANSETERMRKAVGNRVRNAVERIERLHPELGRHLRVSVRTGTFCRYDPDREVRWRL